MCDDYILVNEKHEGIITIELCEKVQALYKLKSGKPPKTFEGSFPLSVLIKYPVCGSSMVAHRSKKKNKDGSYTIHRYYACSKWRNQCTAECNSNSVKSDYAETYIFKRLKEILNNSQILKDIVENVNKKRKNIIKPLKEELTIITKKINECTKKRDKYYDLYMDNLMSKEVLSQSFKNWS